MVIYFVSALLVATVVYKLGAYVTIVSLMITATKVVVALVVLVGVVLLHSRYVRKSKPIKLPYGR